MARGLSISTLVLSTLASCTTSRPSDAPTLAVTVLTTRGCAQTDGAEAEVTRVASRLSIPIRLERVLVETQEDAQRLRLLGSPTVLIDGRDLDPAARARTDYGFSWRVYGPSAVPPEEMVERALREAVASRASTIVLEAQGFGWGAVAGLGWGSTLAPVLARLGGVTGVRDARVDWTGRYFLLCHDSSTTSAAVVAEASEVLGPTTRRLSTVEEREQVETYVAGAPWLRAGETARLSRHEAETLAERYASMAARTVGLDDERTGKLVGLVRDELVVLFGRFESSGLPARDQMRTEWAELAARVGTRSGSFLTEEEAARLGEALAACCLK